MNGEVWARLLVNDADRVSTRVPSVVAYDGALGGQTFRTIAIVPDAQARSPRARHGEFGLDEGVAVAHAVRGAPAGAAIVAIVDVPGQAFGRLEESAGISLSLAASVDAYVTERRRGRAMFTLVVGRAISGAFLAHGMQGGWIGALRCDAVEVHVMSAASVARVTRMDDAEVARVASVVPATARDIDTFATFGAIDELFSCADPQHPTPPEIETIRSSIVAARNLGLGLRHPIDRLASAGAIAHRALARDVRRRIDAAW